MEWRQMFQFQWSREVHNYFADNEGLINPLELAFAEYRKEGTRVPQQGVVDMIDQHQYTWGIHDHLVLVRLVQREGEWKIRVEVIRPIRSFYDDLLLGGMHPAR